MARSVTTDFPGIFSDERATTSGQECSLHCAKANDEEEMTAGARVRAWSDQGTKSWNDIRRAVDLTSHCSEAVKCSGRAGASLPDNFCGVEYAEAASSASILVVT